MDFEVSASVKTVTVYTEQARITVVGQVELQAGLHTLVVDELPLTLDPNSVRAAGRGNAVVRLLGVEVQRHHFVTTPADKVRALEDKIEQHEQELRQIEDELALLESHATFLDGLRSENEQYARGLALGRTKIEDLERMGTFILERDQALRASRRDLEKQKRTIGRDLDQSRRELSQLGSTRPPQRNRVLVELEALEPGSFEIELTYNVAQAAWQPLYDVRLVEDGERCELAITGLAQVTQNSGQDWNGIDLRVSTARVDLNRRLPELRPWYIDVNRPPIARMMGGKPFAASKARGAPPPPSAATKDMVMEAAHLAEAQMVTAEIETGEPGATVTYSVAGRAQIPSDGAPHKTLLYESVLPASIDYIAIPKHTEAIFRRTTADNIGSSPLLAGPVQLFVGSRYIGTTKFEFVPSGDEVELLLGTEDRLAVERKMVRRDVDKTRLRDRRQLQYGYEIELRNLMPIPVNIEVHDHLPVSRHEEISSKLLRSTPEPDELSELNLMKWKLALGAGEKARITYEFQVEHPRSMVVVGLIE